MYARIALSVVLAAAFCAPSSASRKFTGSESLVYESENPIVEGLGEFGLSAWILVRDDGGDEPSTQGIVDNLRTPDGNGFTLYYERVDTVRSLVFRYQGDLSRAKSGLIETRANLGMTQIGKWIHVAADLSLTTAMKTKARIWINGRPGKVGSGPPFKAMTGSPMLFIGGRPRLSGSGEDTGFGGDVHDVCIVGHRWTRKQLNQLSKQKQSARDVAPLSTIRFNPRLRDNESKDDISGIVPQVFGEIPPIKGMGPPLIYSDQKPTVLVFGDLQKVADMTDTGMEDIGQFICDYKDTLEVAAVFHVGDWSNYIYPATAEVRALAEKLVDAGIPWSCTLGNHDYDYGTDQDGGPDTRKVEDYWADAIPEDMFRVHPDSEEEYEWFVGQMGTELEGVSYEHADGDYAHAFTFELDDVTQLGIVLPWGLTTWTLDWACDVARPYWTDNQKYPGLRVWVVTHLFYTGGDGYNMNSTYGFESCPQSNPEDACEPTYYEGRSAKNAVEDWFKDENEQKNIDDLAFVFCGHVGGARQKKDTTNSGLPFYSLLINYQGDENYMDQGVMHILSVKVVDDAPAHFYVETYAPLCDEFIDGVGCTFDDSLID